MRATRSPMLNGPRVETPTPLFRGADAYCPRCRGLLLHDYGELSCIACAYAFDGPAIGAARRSTLAA